MKAFSIHVSGLVQGVGFRPFVYRLALRYGLFGWVYNASDGVSIHVEGDQEAILGFMQAVQNEHPEIARIDRFSSQSTSPLYLNDFSIRMSSASPMSSTPEALLATNISPDLATCPNCLRELFDPTNRRFGYPFINCTDCGPRFTIIQGLPYDRPLTTMRGFPMCKDCALEYDDPADRRFHAQPDACFACGPRLSVFIDGQTQEASDLQSSQALLRLTVEAIKAGNIVAIKSLGGYHLACDATNDQAVMSLRERKKRSNKPFALMMASLNWAKNYCYVDKTEASLLEGSVRPIVLLQRKDGAGQHGFLPISNNVAGNLPELGVMLAYTPVQHLLFHELDRPLVMTSGNLSDEPIIADTDQAHQLLDGIADMFLDNNRPISNRYDDSVVRVVNGRRQMIRRARGYAPLPLRLAGSGTAEVLAVGPEQKNTFCFTRGNEAFLSQHLGDLDSSQALANWDETRHLYQGLFGLKAKTYAADLHPEYLSTKWAVSQSRQSSKPLVYVQHHHAHIAAVLAEAQSTSANAPDELIGFAFDGTGLGDDGSIWGGEVLLCNMDKYQRLAYLQPTAMPGGSMAVKEVWRMAFAYLAQYSLLGHPGADGFMGKIAPETKNQLELMIERQINSPKTSSMGRLFDAVSALVGLCQKSTYEGEAAIELEAAIAFGSADHEGKQSGRFEAAALDALPYEFAFDGELIVAGPVIRSILDDLVRGTSLPTISRRFHQAVVDMVVSQALFQRNVTGINDIALSGGVFMNRYLIEKLPNALSDQGFIVYLNNELPPNDACIAFGQAAIVRARLAQSLV
ncbi:MAG: carbamoyltransferase HypF [Coriobacteriia bacterium]|nr:carbamoyltransferase HypF [Coriobacteriia bacterium]